LRAGGHAEKNRARKKRQRDTCGTLRKIAAEEKNASVINTNAGA